MCQVGASMSSPKSDAIIQFVKSLGHPIEATFP